MTSMNPPSSLFAETRLRERSRAGTSTRSTTSTEIARAIASRVKANWAGSSKSYVDLSVVIAAVNESVAGPTI